MTGALLYCGDEPFTVRPDPRFQFDSRSFHSAFLAVKRAIDEQAGISLVVGAAGCGKTMLLKAVENALAREDRRALLRIPKWDSDLLAWLLGELGQDRSGARAAVSVDALRLELEQNAAPTILLLDGVDDVQDRALSDLLELAVAAPGIAGHLQLVATGRSQLIERLHGPQFSRHVRHAAVIVRIEPLLREELSDYITHRLALAGRKGAEFDRAAIDLVFRYSNGIPFRVNRICACALAQGRPDVGSTQIEKAARICGSGADECRRAYWPSWYNERHVSGGLMLAALGALAISLGSFAIYDAANLRKLTGLDLGTQRALDWQRAALEGLKKAVDSMPFGLADSAAQKAHSSQMSKPAEQATPADYAFRRGESRSGSPELPTSDVTPSSVGIDPDLGILSDDALEPTVSMGEPDQSSSEEASPVPLGSATNEVTHRQAEPVTAELAAAALAVGVSPEARAPDGGAGPGHREEAGLPLPKTRVHESELKQLMERGKALLRDGDVAAARLCFEYVAKWDSGAAVAVGQTYDPIELRKLGIVGMRGDAERAAEWYRRALAAGEQSSRGRLADLADWTSRHGTAP
jgi:general secretion pathway protein A